jgi:hypothetical protein
MARAASALPRIAGAITLLSQSIQWTDCTFYYTNEYYATTSSFNWRTRIGYFKFATCTAL